MRRRVVITGIGLVSPLGCEVPTAWDRLLAGESAVSRITKFDPTGFRSQIAAEVASDFTTDGFLEYKEARHLDDCARYGIVAAHKAVADSGIEFSQEDPLRCASIIGTGVGGLETLQAQVDRLRARGPAKVSPFAIPMLICNAASGHVSIIFNLQGPSYSVASACASAAHAMAAAVDMIRLGKVDVALTGGTEAAIVEVGVGAFGSMRATSERNDEPQRASRPFDRDRDGFVMGEGAGVLVFEELEHAKRRGAHIYAEVLGYGMSSDAFHIVQPSENGEGPAAAMRFALADGGLEPEMVDYINAHGTSTQLGDLAETNAIKLVFGDAARRLNISSTKSEIGHLLGASGALELIFSVLSIRDGLIPPTINLETPDPQCDLNYTPNVAVARRCDYVLSNSFGFGGHNATLLVGRMR